MNKKKILAGSSTKAVQHLPDAKRVYTLKDMATMFSVSLKTIYNWMDQNRFSFVKIGSKTYVTEDQLQEFLTTYTVKVGRRLSW